jgi:hypothetical protein
MAAQLAQTGQQGENLQLGFARLHIRSGAFKLLQAGNQCGVIKITLLGIHINGYNRVDLGGSSLKTSLFTLRSIKGEMSRFK